MTIYSDTSCSVSGTKAAFQRATESYCQNFLQRFKKKLRAVIYIHLGIICLLFSQFVLFLIFLLGDPKTEFLAITLSSILLTVFVYLILAFYLQSRKKEVFQLKKEVFITHCRKILPKKELSASEYHLLIAGAAYRFAILLQNQEYHCYYYPKKIVSLKSMIQKISFLLHFKDMHMMKELMHLASIEEHIALIKQVPTDLEAHASLANSNIALSRVYKIPADQPIVLNRHLKFFEEKEEMFSSSVKRAIEEFKIMDYYAQSDPWVHAQLASCYHDLEMYDMEIKEYEIILELKPNDKEIMYRLGLLYFKQGKNSHGLQIYDTLKHLHFTRANDLIEYYDANIQDSYQLT